ncbi:MAG: hypothetical protein WC802_03385 [Patescibacteria group bacterium]|jgi:hypothetical protein
MKYSFFSLLFVLCGVFFWTNHASALTVSPVKMEIGGDPGQILTGDTYLVNEENHEMTYYSSFEKFDAQGESGNPVFSPTTEGLATWMSIRPSITIQPHARLTVPYRITIPKNAPPGGNFAAIFWNTVPPSNLDSTQVAIGAKVGILVLLRVSGDITEGGTLLSFGIENGQTFFTTPPVGLWYRFNNNGEDRVKPSGTITIKNTFGMKSAQFNANPTDGNVLPGSIRRLTTAWNDKDAWGNDIQPPEQKNFGTLALYELKHFHLGRFSASLHLEYGTAGKTVDAKVSFFMIPWHALVIIIPALIILMILGIISIKRYNRWIIARANASRS